MAEQPGETLVRPDGVELRYWSSGRGDPVVFLHGLAGYGGEWWPFFRRLGDDLTALVVDQRGHGRSTRRPADLSRRAYVDDVAALIEAGAAGRAVPVVGQSMGAHTAMLTAATHPELVSRLVLVEGGVGGGGEVALDQLQRSLARWPSSFPDCRSALQFFGSGPAAEAWVEGLEARDGALYRRFDVDVLVEAMRPILQAPDWAAWEAVRQPTLIVLGDSGTVDRGEVDRMTRGRPNVQVETIPAAGHDVHLDQPQVLATTLRAFLDP